MICLAVTYVIKAGHEDDAVGRLRVLTAATRLEPGCRFYQAHRSPTDPRRFFLYEQYDDQAALNAHRAAPYFIEHVLGGLVPIAESRSPELYDPIGELAVQPGSEKEADRTKPGWTQASLRALLVLVAVAAVSLWGYRHWLYDGSFSVTYPVGDLVPGYGPDAYEPLIKEIKTSVQPGSWDGRGGTGSMTEFFLSRSLIVRNNRAAHAEIRAALDKNRVKPAGR